MVLRAVAVMFLAFLLYAVSMNVASTAKVPFKRFKGECPEIKDSGDPSDPSLVRDLFADIHGCDVPLREGIGHIPWRRGDFGHRHIVSRHAEGEANHETTPYAKGLWQEALLQKGIEKGREYFCHSQRYTRAGDIERTMKVFLDYKPLSAS